MRRKHRPENTTGRDLWLRCALYLAGMIFFMALAAARAMGGDYYADNGDWAFPEEDYDDIMSADDHHMAMRMQRLYVGSKPIYTRSKASRKHDSITIIVKESTSSSLESSNDLKRNSSNNMVLSSWLVPSTSGGLNIKQKGTASGDADAKTPTIDYSTNRAHKSDSTIDRAQTLNSTLTGEVTEVMTNGYLVVQARKRVSVNGEDQTLLVTGLVNPVHLDSTNSIKAEYIIDMKVSYFGNGPMTRMDKRGWGSKVIDFLNPF